MLAGPGTGKTHVLTRRAQFLIDERDIPAKKILALTFTRAAAASMRERLEQQVGRSSAVRISTLHSFALRELIREGARDLPSPVRVVDDWEERWVVVAELARFLATTVREITNSRGSGLLDRLADDWDTLAINSQGWEDGFPDPRFLSAWRQHREVYGYTLRAELVYQLMAELRSNPDFSPSEAAVVLVDEYQDLNHCELDTIHELTVRAEAEIFAAGDDDQSIYRFRHALPLGIRQFTDYYPNSRRLLLSECMRCGPAIVELANWLIQHDLAREPKTLVSVTDWEAAVRLVRFQSQQSEAAGAARILRAEVAAGTPAHEILVLVKSDLHDRIFQALQEQLSAVDLKMYRPRGRSGESPEMQRLLEFLVLADSLEDDRVDDLALRSLFELENNRIGEERLWRVTKLALDKSVRFNAAIDYARDHPNEFPTGQFALVVSERDRILDLANQIQPTETESFDEWLARVAELLDIPDEDFELVVTASHEVSAMMEDQIPSQPEQQNGQSEDESNRNDVQSRKNFLQELKNALSQLSDTLPAHIEGHVTFTTMHGAKGLSADVVLILQAEDEVIPGEAAGEDLNELRRLFYVSVTRARKKLIISACERRTGPQRFVGRIEAVTRHLTRFVRDYGLQAVNVNEYVRELGNSL